MNPQEMQPNNPQVQDQTQMTPDEAKASLGIATRLSQQVFNPKQDGGQQMGGQGDNLDQKFQGFMKEVKSMLKEEIGGIKADIQDALKEEDSKENDKED